MLNKQRTGFHCGYVAIVGRSNVGKSTFLNHALGTKVSITSHKAHTTRHCVRGILNETGSQLIFVDTPGFQGKTPYAMNRLMHQSMMSTLADVDAVLFMVEANTRHPEDEIVLQKLPQKKPVFLIMNKSDQVPSRPERRQLLAQWSSQFHFVHGCAMAAKHMHVRDFQELFHRVAQHMPEQPAYFETDRVTDRSVRFLAAECVREKLHRLLGQELPYMVTAYIDELVERDTSSYLHGTILVAKDSHKPMVVGYRGRLLKMVGIAAREDLERLLAKKIFLELRVKVQKSWMNDTQELSRCYHDVG